MDRWSLFVDVEGFAKIYPQDVVAALLPLRSIMENLYAIGTTVSVQRPPRLFAHQIGDGFIVVADSDARCPELPMAMGAFLLRGVLEVGGMAKCSVSQGDFSDIQGCYPDIIRNNADPSGALPLGRGLMRTFPVMGSALINAYRYAHRESGSLLIVDSSLSGSIGGSWAVTHSGSDYEVVDWIHAATPELQEIASLTGVSQLGTAELETRARAYIAANVNLPAKWRQNTIKFNQL